MAAAAPPLSVPRVARLARRDPRQSRRLAPRRASHVQVRALRSLLAMERADCRDAMRFQSRSGATSSSKSSSFGRRDANSLARSTAGWSRLAPRSARRRSLRKVCARWQRMRLSVPFDDWVEWAEEVKSNRRKFRGVRRLRKATVLAAWARWIEFTGESRRQRVLLARATRCWRDWRTASRFARSLRWRDLSAET